VKECLQARALDRGSDESRATELRGAITVLGRLQGRLTDAVAGQRRRAPISPKELDPQRGGNFFRPARPRACPRMTRRTGAREGHWRYDECLTGRKRLSAILGDCPRSFFEPARETASVLEQLDLASLPHPRQS